MTTLIRGSMSACMRSTTRSSRSINSYRNCSLAYMRPGVRTFSLSTRLYRNATFRMEAEASAPRLQTTPLVFLSPPGRDASTAWHNWMIALSNNGFDTTCFELPAPSSDSVTVKEYLEEVQKDIRARLSSLPNRFPPLLIANSITTIAAQHFVESNPVTGLALFSPWCQKKFPVSHNAEPTLETPNFTFEPDFPILVVSFPYDKLNPSSDVSKHRLVQDADGDVEHIEISDKPHVQEGAEPEEVDVELGLHAFEIWRDEVGL